MTLEDDAHAMAERPQSLRQAAVFGLAFGERDASLREFLDEFYVADEAERRAAMLIDEPPMTGDDRANAYYAAVAEQPRWLSPLISIAPRAT